jgi:hypothetical protein
MRVMRRRHEQRSAVGRVQQWHGVGRAIAIGSELRRRLVQMPAFGGD